MGHVRQSPPNSGRDVHNVARLGMIAPASSGGLHHVPGAVEVGVDDRVPALVGEIHRVRRELAAGVVDQHVQAAEALPYGFEQRFDLLGVADAHREGEDLAAAAEAAQLLGAAAKQGAVYVEMFCSPERPAMLGMSYGAWLEALEAAADRRGDIYLLQGKRTEARDEFSKAFKGLDERSEYRRLVEVKLNSLGVDPKPAPEATPTAGAKS